MNTNSLRTTRRLTGLAVALTTVLSVAGVASANHTTCTQAGENYPMSGGNANYCPEFSPNFSYNIRYPYRDTPAAFKIDIGQAKHESLPLRTEVYYPKGWQFSIGTIRPSSQSTCDLAIGAGDQTRAYLAGRPIEALSQAVGMRAYADTVTAQPSPGQPTAGIRNFGNMLATNAGTAGRGMIGFLNSKSVSEWNTAFPLQPLPADVTNRTTLCLAMDGGATKDVVETMYLDQIEGDLDFGWRFTIETGRLFAPSSGYFAAADKQGLKALSIDFNDMSMGNWHLTPNNVKAKAVWSRAPRNSVQTGWKAILSTCRSGVATNGYSLDTCPAAHRWSASKTEPFTVTLPPAMPSVAFSAITSGGGIAIPGTGTAHTGNPTPVSGFGFSDGKELAGGTTIPVKWAVPTLPAGATVTGYAVAIQEITTDTDPTNQDAEIAIGRLRYERFDRAAVCGTGTACTANLDVAGLSTGNGTMDGKYNIGLVTIYDILGNNGYRSDLLCDGKLAIGPSNTDSGRGVLCPAGRPAFLLGAPFANLGASRWQVVVRERAWPTRFRMTNPQSLLLMDMTTREAEYYIWGTTASGGTPPSRSNLRIDVGPGERYYSASNVVANPTAPNTGAFVFGKMNLDQDGSYSWQIVGELGAPGFPLYAQFQEYWSGWANPRWVKPPSINTQNPTATTVCTNAATCGDNQGPPHMVMTTLSGTTF